jgi:uncharacterized protein involved in exopolysaccharide biosynthesis
MPGTNLKDLPDEALEYMRMYRDVETLSKLSAFLLPIYQQALLDEQKQMSVLVPLDQARVPERKDRPRRSLIIIVLTLSVFVLVSAFVLVRERLLQYRADHGDEWERIRRTLPFSGKE